MNPRPDCVTRVFRALQSSKRLAPYVADFVEVDGSKYILARFGCYRIVQLVALNTVDRDNNRAEAAVDIPAEGRSVVA
jgi:hypothetical protein